MEVVNSDRIVDGELVFKMMDTHGLPLETINHILAEKGKGFDVVGFCRAALLSGNHSPEGIKQRLVTAHMGTDDIEPLVKAALVRAAA